MDSLGAPLPLPPLFGESVRGKRKAWAVEVRAEEGGAGTLVVLHGYVGGKQVRTERAVTTGKNTGRKNATTPVAQALSEARALWNKKRDSGYREETAGALGAPGAPQSPLLPPLPPLPMLAHDFTKRGKSIVFPCMAQRKLDGVRCVATSAGGMFTRNGKPASAHLTHIASELQLLPVGVVLDGELYSDELSFQEVVGLVKKASLRAGDAEKMRKVYLYVYDAVQPGVPNLERTAWLTRLFSDSSSQFHALRLLPTERCARAEDVPAMHAHCVAEGYEGLMLRNEKGMYAVGQRSADLQKFKTFLDAEFVVCGFKEGDGIEKGCVIWVCQTPDGNTFSVRPRGTHEERAAEFVAAQARMGHPLTVRYQELTTDKIPRFPVGIGFRDYE